MSQFKYLTGEEIRKGDHILFHGEPGTIEFVIAEPTNDPAMDWYLEKFPGGGFMINARGFGGVFLDLEDIDEKLGFVSRAK